MANQCNVKESLWKLHPIFRLLEYQPKNEMLQLKALKCSNQASIKLILKTLILKEKKFVFFKTMVGTFFATCTKTGYFCSQLQSVNRQYNLVIVKNSSSNATLDNLHQ